MDITAERLVELLENDGKKFFAKHPHFRNKNFEIKKGTARYDMYLTLAMFFLRDPRFLELSSDYSFDKGIYLVGDKGTGKTLAFDLMLGRINKSDNFKHRMVECEILSNDFSLYGPKVIEEHTRGSFELNNTPEGQEIYDETNPIIEVYDDLGNELLSNHFGNKMYAMIPIISYKSRMFMKYGIPTHFTSNKTDDEIGKLYGEGIEDRMKDMCNTVVISGKSLRGM